MREKRTYQILNELTRDDCKWLIETFEDGVTLAIVNEPLQVTHYGRSRAISRSMDTLLTFTSSEESKYLFFNIRFPNAILIDQTYDQPLS